MLENGGDEGTVGSVWAIAIIHAEAGHPGTLAPGMPLRTLTPGSGPATCTNPEEALGYDVSGLCTMIGAVLG